ncbi:MAG: CDP-alcohol phosphatidyltransferase family protein [Candidatus Omnitrophota bacterium]
MASLKSKIASFLYEAGVSANALTILGLASAGLSGFLIYKGYFFWGALALLLSGGLDLVDGAVARMSAQRKPFGGILDSSLDRYGDGLVLGGAVFFCASYERTLYAALAFSALVGSFLISYVRARAECEIENCRVGFWERGERTGCLVVGLLADNLALALWILGIATHFTALFRLWVAGKSGEWGPAPAGWRGPIRNILFHTQGRANPYYYGKAGLIFLALLFLRIPL